MLVTLDHIVFHAVEVRDPAAGGGAVLPVGEDDLESTGRGGVNGAAVGVPPGRVSHSVSVDRQPDGVDTHGGGHVVVQGVGLGPYCRVAVGLAQALQDERAGAEVVTQHGPVHASELVRGRIGR